MLDFSWERDVKPSASITQLFMWSAKPSFRLIKSVGKTLKMRWLSCILVWKTKTRSRICPPKLVVSSTSSRLPQTLSTWVLPLISMPITSLPSITDWDNDCQWNLSFRNRLFPWQYSWWRIGLGRRKRRWWRWRRCRGDWPGEAKNQKAEARVNVLFQICTRYIGSVFLSCFNFPLMCLHSLAYQST